MATEEMEVFHLCGQQRIYRHMEKQILWGRIGVLRLSCMELAGLWGSPGGEDQQARGSSASWVENSLEGQHLKVWS